MRVEDGGSALLVVIGATSALAVVVSLMLLAASTAYEAAVYRADREQARLLAEASIGQLIEVLEASAIQPPAPGRVLRIRNGRIAHTGRSVPVADFPVPSRDWPGVTDQPPGPASTGIGVGAEITVSLVVGPRGDVRGFDTGPDAGTLLAIRVSAWFRHARVEVPAHVIWRSLPTGGADTAAAGTFERVD